MVRLLGLNSRVGIDTAGGGGGGGGPREILKEPNEAGDSGWLIRFFDSTFFDEWIAISYLYKHEHAGVRDYLCNRMYTLPTSGIESYLYQLCFMVIHKPSAALDRFIIDMCSMSLRIAIKVHWFLLAESEDSIDSAHIRNLLEKCQTAALNGDWPPLIKPSKHSVSPGPKRMLKQLLSSRLLSPPNPKQSPPPHSSPVIEDATVRESNILKGASEDLESTFKVFKKFVPGPKVRDALTLKKFREKEDEDVLRSKETDSDSFLRRLLFPQKEDEERAARSDEFSNPDGFFRRFLREKNDGEEKIGEEEKDGFFRRMSFFLKSDERDRNDSREKVDDEEKASMSGGEDDDGPDFFFLRRSRIHPEFDDKSGLPDGITGTPPEKTGESPGEGFFKKLFNNRSSDDNKSSSLKREDSTGNSPGSFLRRFIKERLDDESSSPSVDDGSVQGLPNQGTVVEGVAVGGQTWEKIKDWQYPVKNAPLLCDSESKDPGLLKPNERCADCTEEAELSGKGRKSTDETEELFWSETEESASKDAGVAAEKPSSEPFGFNVVQGQGVVSSPPKKSLSFSKRSGSPLRKPERTFAKPPLPKQSAFKIRKGTYHATLDYVQSLCDMSTGLADVFPLEDRRISLHESLQELNAHLLAAESDGGVCLLMGKGLCRVVHIPEEETVLLSSREKAPFLICVEVLRCDTQRPEIIKDSKESLPKKRSGIPLAYGDLHFPHGPPPWAFPKWNHPMQKPDTEELLRNTSKAIDVALAQSLNSKLKVVDVSLTVNEIETGFDPSKTRMLSTEVDGAPKSVEINSGAGQRVGSSQRSDSNSGRSMYINEAGRIEVSRNADGNARRIDETDRKESASDLTQRLRDKDSSIQGRNGCSERWIRVALTSVAGLSMDDVETDPPSVGNKIHRRVPSTIAMAAVTAAAAKGEAPAGLPASTHGTAPSETETLTTSGKEVKATDALAGELWASKKERIRRSSKFGNLPEWDLCSMIVKSGDDCRQEHLAVQLIAEFFDIFQDAGLPLWLRPYEVVVTSSHTALIETIPDSLSIHAIKSRNANLSSLREFFCKKYVEKSPEFTLAQRNFVESMAGYSLLCYLLQVKDRHNGNLLLDEEGHIIHIDFGFMLSNSPGGVNFESAPFKLTRELLEVMDSNAEGSYSEFFDYYKVLCIQGFLVCRKNAERIMLLVEMMQDSGCPCYKGGPRTLQNLRKRFHLTLTEQV